MGLSAAKRIVMTGEMLNADKALALGLVDEVVPAAQLMEHTMAFARTLAAKAPQALGLAKVKKVAPVPRFAEPKPVADEHTLEARWVAPAEIDQYDWRGAEVKALVRLGLEGPMIPLPSRTPLV